MLIHVLKIAFTRSLGIEYLKLFEMQDQKALKVFGDMHL